MRARSGSTSGAASRGGARGLIPGLSLVVAMLLTTIACESTPRPSAPTPAAIASIQLGPRPFYLIDRMPAGALRDRLAACQDGPFRTSRFSIGHRGAPMQFPEHTRESYLAAARMGAGTIECDVTATRDGELVCRHAACDLARTTNILETPLASRCRESFRPAAFDPESGALSRPASARCCTADLTLAEFLELEGRMDAADHAATTVTEYLDATPAYRTDLYANGGQLMSHDESLRLFRELGVAMTPELKGPAPDAQETLVERAASARALLSAYQRAGISPQDVRLQSFFLDDLRTWLEADPELGARAVWLIETAASKPPTPAELAARSEEGIRTLGVPIAMLLRLDGDGELRASELALQARAVGLELIAWTLERSGRIRAGRVEGSDRDFYLDPVLPALGNDGDLYRVIHALATEVGVVGVFSDWPATTTYYANCFGLE